MTVTVAADVPPSQSAEPDPDPRHGALISSGTASLLQAGGGRPIPMPNFTVPVTLQKVSWLHVGSGEHVPSVVVMLVNAQAQRHDPGEEPTVSDTSHAHGAGKLRATSAGGRWVQRGARSRRWRAHHLQAGERRS